MDKILKYLKGDAVLWVIALLMLAFSLVTVYSFVPILVKVEGGTPFGYLFRHIVYAGIALGGMYWIHQKDPKYINQAAKFAFYLSVAILIFTLFFGVKVNNAGRWVRVPFIGLTFQASDFARLALILYVSRLLVAKKGKLNKWKEGFFPVVLPIVVICALIVKDNFSTAAILFGVSLMLLFLGRVPFFKIFALIGGGVLLLVFIVLVHKAAPELNLLPRYQTWENRIINQVSDEENVIENAQANNAQLAIYNGGPLLGRGVGNGKLKEFIPEAYADFYFASFVEEFGLISSIVLILIYLILLYRIMRIGLNSKKMFETYACIGIGMLMLSQATVNMLVCVGIFPVTGQNMPLLAMGGSALMMTCFALGIVLSISAQQQKVVAKEEDELILESV
ncbi:MAG: FtsW/RodA/SpoVE family cell cycle protein [Crocinitomicaceae bacterium]|jgi:cell division protein FtsW|nr:FtsW/RodA/SpoVE family cell cycle protein [Crocinitomicaceae bacterium]MDG1658003.1 FtsW/RodA/SpoVE family cell cycle protein [Crocinitomicaceae bacterium]MDG2440607.1 FtsW/RodA/SpoVE family cell cycle protein [Crocinitomicaceae bacterium]